MEFSHFDLHYLYTSTNIIKPAVEECGLIAYRVDRDPYVEIAVSAIEEKIRDATIVVAEISVDNPNVWFELGYAMALDKKIIMLCDVLWSSFFVTLVAKKYRLATMLPFVPRMVCDSR